MAHTINGDTAVKIADSIEAGVASGELSAGMSLPPIRQLADRLEVNRNTVSSAYKRLAAAGIVISDGRRGTQIASAPPVAPVDSETVEYTAERRLDVGGPDPALLPNMSGFLAQATLPQRGYGEQTNLPALLDIGQEHFASDGFVDGRMSICAGALDGLERVLRTHLRPGDAIGLEDPGFLAGAALVRSLGFQPVPVEIDQRGMVPASLERALGHRIRALVVTPRAQNPTGACMDARRSDQLRGILQHQPTLMVVEDDHAALITPAAVESVAYGHVGPWAILRSVGKALGPDLRLGFILGDSQTVARFEGHLALGTRWVSHVLQHLVVEMWHDDGVKQLIRLAAQTYAKRREALLERLDHRGIKAVGVTGLNVWIPTHRETPAVQSLERLGWIVAPGEGFRIDAEPGIRITISQLEVADADALAVDVAASVSRARQRPAA